jgi:HAD superfamily hydrolase (TIGR01509 family)
MAELKALIFDVDGTLADTERDGHRVAFNRAFQDAGLDWSWSVEHYGRLLAISGGKERIRYFINHSKPDGDLLHDQERFIDALHRCKTEHYLQLLKSGAIPLRTGVARLIQEARNAHLALAIATTSSLESVNGLLQSTLGKISVDCFEVIGAGDMVAYKKPAPDIYHYVLQAIGYSADHCVALEDSRNGLLAARAAGLGTIVTVNEYTQNEDMSDAALVVDQAGEPPNQPFKVLLGDAGGASYLTLDLIRRLLH